MKLVSFSITNYRSITTAHKINLDKYTVLVGKNNEGKSNILRALDLAMNILINHSTTRGRLFTVTRYTNLMSSYNWENDFPMPIQNRKNNLQSVFRLEFNLNENELVEFQNEIGSKLNGNIAIEIKIDKNNIHEVRVPKQGKNAMALTAKSDKVADFISQRISINYIPAVRTESNAINEIRKTIAEELETIEFYPEYIEAVDTINTLQQEVLDKIAHNIKKPLQLFIPTIKGVDIKIMEEYRKRSLRYDVDVVVDDGNATSIEYKGDGVKSLASIAMLKDKTYYKSLPIIAIEEPESHLHPAAINQLYNVIQSLTEFNQVIVTTHNPLFVDRIKANSNIIIENGKAKPAKDIKQIRDVLGVKVSDNLINAKYVLVVEGEDDKISLLKILPLLSDKLRYLINSNNFCIEEIGGAGNLSYKLSNLKNSICLYHVLLDKDKAGRTAYEKAEKDGLIDIKNTTFTSCRGMDESEFEDCLNVDIYSESIKSQFGVELKTCKYFRGSKKWSDRVKDCFVSYGKLWSDSLEKKIKVVVANSVYSSNNIACMFIEQKKDFLNGLVSSLESLITEP